MGILTSKEKEMVVAGLWVLHDKGSRTEEEKQEIKELAKRIMDSEE